MVNAGLKLTVLAALLSTTTPAMAQINEAELGRLFTSSSERHVLSRMRDHNLNQDDSTVPVAQNLEQLQTQLQTQTNTAEKATNASSKSIVFNGVITHSNGDKVIWINGKQVDNNRSGDVKITHGSSRNDNVTIVAPGKRAVELKPGQQLQLDNGNVMEGYLSSNKKTDDVPSP